METQRDIKKRMISNAAKFWGLTNREMQSIDPLIPLLIDATASEIEKISHSINEVRQNMGLKLMELLTPEALINPLPARAIMLAYPFETRGVVDENHEFYYYKKNPIDEEEPDLEIFFTPLKEHILYDGAVNFIASGNTLYYVDQFGEKSVACKSMSNNRLQDSIWIGLNLNDSITSLSGMSFYFEIENINDIHENIFHQALKSSEWEINNSKVKVQPGFNYTEKTNEKNQIRVPYTEFNKSFAVTNQVLNFYKKHFISFSENQWETIVNQEAYIEYPRTFMDIFSMEDLEVINSKLLWIKVNLRYHVPQHLFDNMKCAINCFPVINRKKEKMVITGYDRIKELISEQHEVFFDLVDIFCEEELEIIMGDKPPENMENKAFITLRKDSIGRMNTTDSINKIQELIRAHPGML